MAETTIGQYYPKNSIIHRLDPRIKLCGTMLFIIALFFSNNLLGYSLTIFLLACVIKLSKIPFKSIVKGIRGIIFIIIFGFIFNVLFETRGTLLVNIWKIRITDIGLESASFVALRLVLLIMGTSIMTLTTKPSDLSDGLEKSFGFLKVLHVPVHEIAMIMSLALRFIPTLMDETDKIVKAQKARGADFDGKNIFSKVNAYLPLLIPLFVSSMSRALDLAVAMEARCYRGGNRTKLYPLVYKKRDYIAYGLFLAFVVVIVGLNIMVDNIEVMNNLLIKVA